MDGESHFKTTHLTELKEQMAIDTHTNQVAKAQGFHVFRLSYKDQEDFLEEMEDAVKRVLKWDKEREAGTDDSPLCIFSKKYCIPDSDGEDDVVPDSDSVDDVVPSSRSDGEAPQGSDHAEAVPADDDVVVAPSSAQEAAPPSDAETESDPEVQEFIRSRALILDSSESEGGADAESSDGATHAESLHDANEPSCCSPTCPHVASSVCEGGVDIARHHSPHKCCLARV